MNIGCSSESFARSIASGDLTQLEWLDACANELEVDGVAFSTAHFPRTDDEYLAQLKKTSIDLGLSVAAVSPDAAFWNDGDATFDLAVALGAPLLIIPAAPMRDDPNAWGAFTDAVKARSRIAKARNVTLAVRNGPDTLCASGADLHRLAKDVDSAWLRFAPDLATLDDAEARALLPTSVITTHTIAALETFATPHDPEATTLITRLARFRAFTLLEAPPPGITSANPTAYHAAIERFAALRAQTLTAPTLT